jgi:Tfp pilus assembly protein PilX
MQQNWAIEPNRLRAPCQSATALVTSQGGKAWNEMASQVSVGSSGAKRGTPTRSGPASSGPEQGESENFYLGQLSKFGSGIARHSRSSRSDWDSLVNGQRSL